MSVAFVGGAASFAEGFVPVEVRAASVTYIRIGAFSALSSAMETAVATATRALDKPDVPLVISSAKFAANILLDMLLISTFRVGSHTPSVNMQAGIQLGCNLAAAGAGLVYFACTTSLRERRQRAAGWTATSGRDSTRPSLAALVVLIRPGLITMFESAVRNSLYLWLITTIVALGSTYATAWGIFVTMRWGLIMVSVLALEATTLTFDGHAWGVWRRSIGVDLLSPRADWSTLRGLAGPAVLSSAIALVVEVPLCVCMSIWGARPFARYLGGGSEEVASVAEKMWRTIDWCYVLFAVSQQFAAVLLATRPK